MSTAPAQPTNIEPYTINPFSEEWSIEGSMHFVRTMEETLEDAHALHTRDRKKFETLQQRYLLLKSLVEFRGLPTDDLDATCRLLQQASAKALPTDEEARLSASWTAVHPRCRNSIKTCSQQVSGRQAELMDSWLVSTSPQWLENPDNQSPLVETLVPLSLSEDLAPVRQRIRLVRKPNPNDLDPNSWDFVRPPEHRRRREAHTFASPHLAALSRPSGDGLKTYCQGLRKRTSSLGVQCIAQPMREFAELLDQQTECDPPVADLDAVLRALPELLTVNVEEHRRDRGTKYDDLINNFKSKLARTQSSQVSSLQPSTQV